MFNILFFFNNPSVEAFCKAGKVPYFRINAFLSDLMELDEPQDYRIVNCLWETKRFMHYRRDQVKVLVNYLETCTQGLPSLVKKGSKQIVRLSKERLPSKTNSFTSPTTHRGSGSSFSSAASRTKSLTKSGHSLTKGRKSASKSSTKSNQVKKSS